MPGWRVGGFSCWPGRVCVACAPGLACACVRIACAPAVCADCFHRGRVPGPFRDRIGGAVAAAWWSWCRVDRRAGLLPVLAAWCGRSCGRVCAHSPGGDAGGYYGGAFGPAACGGSLAGCTGKSRKIYRKIPRKNAHEKIFKKISPYGGTVCTRKIFAKRGLTTTRGRDIFQAQQATRHRDA